MALLAEAVAAVAVEHLAKSTTREENGATERGRDESDRGAGPDRVGERWGTDCTV